MIVGSGARGLTKTGQTEAPSGRTSKVGWEKPDQTQPLPSETALMGMRCRCFSCGGEGRRKAVSW